MYGHRLLYSGSKAKAFPQLQVHVSVLFGILKAPSFTAEMMLQHRSLFQSSATKPPSLPAPCPWAKEAAVNIQFSKNTTVSCVVPLILIPGAPQKSILLSAPLGMWHACLHWSFGKTQRRSGYCFSLRWTCAISKTCSLQLVFFVKRFWLSCRDNYTAGQWEILPSSWRLLNRCWLRSETWGPAVITPPLN